MEEPIQIGFVPASSSEAYFLQKTKYITELSERPNDSNRVEKELNQAFEQMDPQSQTKWAELHAFAKRKLFYLSHQSVAVAEHAFPFPERIQHQKTEYHAYTPACRHVKTIFEAQFQFPHLETPKTKFVLYGIHGSGKTALVHEMYRILTSWVPSSFVMHFHEDVSTWKRDEMEIRWKEALRLVTSLTKQHDQGWILFDVEHIDLLSKIQHYSLPEMDRVIFVGMTSKPSECLTILPKREADYIFVDNPDQFVISALLEMAFLAYIHPWSEIASSSSTYLPLWKKIQNALQLIASQLTCSSKPFHTTSSTKYNQLRECSTNSKLKYGITMSTLVTLQIPRFLGTLKTLRKHWYDHENQCVHVGFPKPSICNSEPIALTKEILEKKSELTANEIVAINEDVTCANLVNVKRCTDSASIQLDWKWVEEAQDKIILAAKEILLDVHNNSRLDSDYERLVAFFLAN
jgi:molybdopterin-guanine dinucleotide biosynthesis protein